MIRAAVIFLALTLAAHAADLDVPRFLSALRQVEGWHGRDGRKGERGPWQITRDVWSMQMPGRPFAEARQEGPASACAVKHITWLRAQLRTTGCDDGVYMIALCWNAGLDRVLSGKAPMASYDYALRVENLYNEQPFRSADSPLRLHRPTARTCAERPDITPAASYRVCLPSTD